MVDSFNPQQRSNVPATRCHCSPGFRRRYGDGRRRGPGQIGALRRRDRRRRAHRRPFTSPRLTAMRLRTVLLLFIAVGLAGGTAMLARAWLAAQRAAEIAEAAPLALPTPAKSVLVARADVRRGQILKPEDMMWQVWPEGGIDKSYVVLGTRTPESFAGWVARNPVAAGEPVTESKIISPSNRGFLAAVLRPGMRAISVPVTITSGISGFIFPGDQVDLLITYQVPSQNTNGASGGYEHKAAETVLNDVRVIAIDQRLESKAVVIHKILVLAAAGSVFIGLATSNAAELLSPPAAPAVRPAAGTTSAPPSGVSQVPAKGPPILLEAGKGTLIRLPRPAATVFIANPDVADVQVKSPSMIYVNAKTPGETVLYAVDQDDNVLLNATFRVEHDVSRLRESLHALIPGENVAVESVDGSLVLKGNVSTALRAEKANALATSIANEAKGKVVNQLSVATPNQVNLQVKIAEVDRTVLKALGVNWTKLNGNTTFATNNPTTGGQIAVQNAINFALGPKSALTNLTVDALAQEGLITILAEPNLTATSGQP